MSQYINAFAITQLCGVFCAPWNGLLMDRHKRKPLAAGDAEYSLFLLTWYCLFERTSLHRPSTVLLYSTLFLCGLTVYISLLLPVCRTEWTWRRPAGLCASSVLNGVTVLVVFHLCHRPNPATSVFHIRPAGHQPLFPLQRPRSLHQCGVSVKHACTNCKIS